MSRHRLVYVGLTLGLAVLAVAVAWLMPAGEESGLPEPLEGVFPEPGDAVVRQTVVEVDLPVGYEIELWVDGDPVPVFEIGGTESTGKWVWQPGPGRSMEQWSGGEHTVRVRWDRPVGRPDQGEFEWSFRVQ